MFGFVKPYVPELKMKEHEFYKSVYCGLCKSMGNTTGNVSRLTLNYDITFLALVRMAMTEESFEIKKKRCPRHPLKKRLIMQDNDFLKFSSKISAYLFSYKVKDNIDDEKGTKRLKAKIAYPFSKRFKRRANLEGVDEKINLTLEELNTLEKEKCDLPDKCAEVFGRLLSYVSSIGLEGSKKRIMEDLAFSLGKWIYLADAIVDYNEDVKKGRYNPFIYMYNKNEMKDFVFSKADDFLFMEAERINNDVNLIESDNELCLACIKNIINYGMYNSYIELKRKGWEND